MPDGEVLPQPVSSATILRQFADAWRVGVGPSLLDAPVAGSDLAPITPATVSTTGAPTFAAPVSITQANVPGAIWTGGAGAAGPVEIEGTRAVLGSGVLANLAVGDLIDVTDLAGATGSASDAAGTLELADGMHSLSIRVAGTLPGAQLAVTADPHGGLLLHIR